MQPGPESPDKLPDNEPRPARVDPELLREMGFPAELIDEALRREAAGVHDVPVPADLLERTQAAMAHMFDEKGDLKPEYRLPARDA